MKIMLTFLFLAASLGNYAQQSLSHTATKENISCNYDCTVIDNAALNDNPAALLYVEPVTGKGAILNQHPIGAYYFKNKWHILNLDGRPIPVASKFTVSYYLNPDEKHFQYSFTRSDIQADGSGLIDHPALNNNPSAQISSFLSWDPNAQGGTANREEISLQYNTDAGKWSVSNVNKKPMIPKATYNIALSDAGTPVIKPPGGNIIQPINELTIPANTSQSGPVTGMFMSVWAEGSKLPGESSKSNYTGAVELIAFDMSGTAPDVFAATKRKHAYELVVQKTTGGAATLPYADAFVKGKSLVIQIDVISIQDQMATEFLNYTIKLSGARFGGFRQIHKSVYDDAKHTTMNTYVDEIRIIFTKIEYINNSMNIVDNL